MKNIIKISLLVFICFISGAIALTIDFFWSVKNISFVLFLIGITTISIIGILQYKNKEEIK